jgi:hypothetical protein
MTYDIDTFLATYPDAVRDTALALRRAIRVTLPDATEILDVPARIVGYSVGPGYAGDVCTIIPSKKGVKLGIARGASLSDPRGLLEGTGKVHRYIAMAKPADVKRPGVTTLIKAAVATARRASS